MKLEKKNLGSEASSYSMKESSSSKAEARPKRRRERTREEEENMVEIKVENSFSTSCVVGGASHTEMRRLLELQEKVQPCMQPGKWFRRAQFTTSRSSFPPCHVFV